MTKPARKHKRSKRLILHPFLIGIYLGLQPIAHNIEAVGLLAIRVLVGTFLAIVIATAVLKKLFSKPRKTGLLVTSGALLLGSYGHVVGYLELTVSLPSIAESVIFSFWILLTIVVTYLILAKIRNPEPWHQYLNIVSCILIVFPLISIFTYSARKPELERHAREYHQQLLIENQLTALESVAPDEGDSRDIFYLVLDAYTREDVLQDLYEYDNDGFTDGLRERGLFVADQAKSNYAFTAYSLSSAFNLSYINEAPAALQVSRVEDPKPMMEDGLDYLIRTNLMVQLLKENEYEIIAFENGYGEAQISGVDIQAQSPDIQALNAADAFEVMWLDSTVGRFFVRYQSGQNTPLRKLYDNHRARVHYGITHLSDYAGRPGSQFVYSHVIAPHSPFVFGPNGEARYGSGPFSLLDNAQAGTWDPGLYRDQVAYLNSLILTEIDEILALNHSDPIIIIHGDHSSRSWPSQDPSEEVLRRLQFPILAAMYLPDCQERVELYSDISPVNITRMLVNCSLGAELETLPDQSYRLMQYPNGWQFTEVRLD